MIKLIIAPGFSQNRKCGGLKPNASNLLSPGLKAGAISHLSLGWLNRIYYLQLDAFAKKLWHPKKTAAQTITWNKILLICRTQA